MSGSIGDEEKIAEFALANKLHLLGFATPCLQKWAIDRCFLINKDKSLPPIEYLAGDYVAPFPDQYISPVENVIEAPNLGQAREFLTMLSGCPIGVYTFLGEDLQNGYEGYYKTQSQEISTEVVYHTYWEALQSVCNYLADVLNRI